MLREETKTSARLNQNKFFLRGCREMIVIRKGGVAQNESHHPKFLHKTKYPDKVTKPKRLVFVRIFLFCSAGSKITYFPTALYI